MRSSAKGSGADQATWTFTVTPGRYRVSATWWAHPNRARNAPYTVYDGASALATVPVNQELTPADFTDLGVGWHDIGGTHDVTGTQLRVVLSDAADQYVIADAVRIERVGELGQ